jgi:hypothetical protein
MYLLFTEKLLPMFSNGIVIVNESNFDDTICIVKLLMYYEMQVALCFIIVDPVCFRGHRQPAYMPADQRHRIVIFQRYPAWYCRLYYLRLVFTVPGPENWRRYFSALVEALLLHLIVEDLRRN